MRGLLVSPFLVLDNKFRVMVFVFLIAVLAVGLMVDRLLFVSVNYGSCYSYQINGEWSDAFKVW